MMPWDIVLPGAEIMNAKLDALMLELKEARFAAARIEQLEAALAVKDADIARMGEALERCEWFKCDTCGRWWPMDDYIEDADGRFGMWTSDGDPQRCPACTAATMKTCPVCGWFMPINTTECDHCMGEGEE